MQDNIYDMRECSASFYGLPQFIEKSKGSVGITPGIYTTDEDFDKMSEERGTLSKFVNSSPK